MYRLMLIVTLLIPMLSLAEGAIYRTTDENGNMVFTDAPPAGSKQSEVVTIQPINTTPAPEIRELTPAEHEAAAGNKTAALGSIVTITKPRNNETIPSGPGNFSTAVKVKPQLDKTQSLQLFLDGVPWGEPQRASTWSLSNIFRGEHELTVGIVDPAGTTVSLSEPVTVYVQRPTINNANPNPNTPSGQRRIFGAP